MEKNLIMSCCKSKHEYQANSLDNIIAQNGTNLKSSLNLDSVLGNQNDKKKVVNRQKRKYLSYHLASRLINYSTDLRCRYYTNDAIVSHIPQNELKRDLNSFWNMFYCSSTMTLSNNKITGNYCKNKLCIICSSIRGNKLYHRYSKYFKQFDENELRFVTMTLQSCKPSELKQRVKLMQKVFRQIIQTFKKRYQRGNMDKFIGLRKIECNFNAKELTYNPHFHCLVVGIDNSHELVLEWKKRIKKLGIEIKDYANPIQRISDKGNHYYELFKYITKIVTPVSGKPANGKTNKSIYLSSTLNIFNAFHRVRTYERFGFNLPNDERPKTNDYSIDVESLDYMQSVGHFHWRPHENDWLNDETNELLSKEQIPQYFKKLVDTIKQTV
jgi:hypothetical protein|tara:strand:- start:738 stop:1889 length:1152 start_codon:yes stop_codon:yes gene_type:complete